MLAFNFLIHAKSRNLFRKQKAFNPKVKKKQEQEQAEMVNETTRKL